MTQPTICSIDSVFLAAVLDEISRARTKHPHFEITLAAMGEEFGEVCKAMLDERAERVWDECVQLAAMALKLAVDGDRSMEAWRNKRQLGGVGRLGPLESPLTHSKGGTA